MKRIFLTLTIACALCAALFAAVPPCKYCGSSNFGSVQQMLSSACSKSPSGKHQPYQDAPRRYHDA
jgi:hypothetical protein